MKMIKIQIKSVLGKLLFEYESENNTIKNTLMEAVKKNTNLRNANLSDANLRNADLSDANLRNANLRNADLSNADLSDTNLWNANLRNANLRNANLSDADLWNANLRNANLRNANLSDAKNLNEANKVPMFCKWDFGFKGELLQIGCESKTIKDWDKFFKSKEIIETERDTKEFKQIEAVYKGMKSYYKHLNK